MKSLLVLVVLAGVVFNFTEGFEIETSKTQDFAKETSKSQVFAIDISKTQALKKCQELKMVKLINQIVKDTKSLKSKAYGVLEETLWGAFKCVFTSFTSLVSCVEGVVEDNVLDFVQEIESYFSTVQSLADKFEELFEECF